MKKTTIVITTFLFFCAISCFAQVHPSEATLSTSPVGHLLDVADGTFDYENSVWVEDWTANLDTDAYIAKLPRGVNCINVFVGQLTFVNGAASINGYSLDTPGQPAGTGAFPDMASLADFVQRCEDAGLSVKLSIGGQAGTTFGNSWNVLTADNVTDFAQALIDLCNAVHADGADFDEELEDTNIATLAGQMAGKFKDLAPYLATSYCVYGGCDANGPWHATNTVFLQYAVTANNWCAIDRIAAMTYYDGCTLDQNEQFMLSWNTWLAQQHGFTSYRISAGVDPNDPTTSPNDGSLATWIQFAASNNLSTAIWDQYGVDDYVQNDWGTKVNNLYKGITLPAASTPEIPSEN